MGFGGLIILLHLRDDVLAELRAVAIKHGKLARYIGWHIADVVLTSYCIVTVHDWWEVHIGWTS